MEKDMFLLDVVIRYMNIQNHILRLKHVFQKYMNNEKMYEIIQI